MNYQAKKNKRVYLETLAVGESFHVPNTHTYGTIIKHGSMGVRVCMDGQVTYNNGGKVILKNNITTIIAGKTECIPHEDRHHGERLRAITKLGNKDTGNSRKTESACVPV